MSLEDQVREQGERYVSLKSLKNRLAEKPYDSQSRIALGNLVHQIEPSEMPNVLVGASNDVVDDYLVNYEERTGVNLNDAVSGKFRRVLDMLDKQGLLGLVFETLPSKTGVKEDDEIVYIHEKYMKLTEGLKQGSIKPYLDLVTDKNARQALEYRAAADPKGVQHNMALYAQILQEQVLAKLDEKGEDYIRTYINRSYNDADDAKKKKMNVEAGAIASVGAETASSALRPQFNRQALEAAA